MYSSYGMLRLTIFNLQTSIMQHLTELKERMEREEVWRLNAMARFK